MSMVGDGRYFHAFFFIPAGFGRVCVFKRHFFFLMLYHLFLCII